MSRRIKYVFEFSNSRLWEYELEFNDHNELIPLPSKNIAEWTKLDFCKCSHCPLSSADHPQCPVARNVDRAVEDTKETLSIETVTVTVKTPERDYVRKCDTQLGLRSLFGLIMATSGCPHLDWLRPLAGFHLPFSSLDETLFRVLGLQLLEEFFREEKGALKDLPLRMKARYEAVQKVNHTFIRRIRNYCSGDADKNAFAGLDLFVQLFELQSEEDFSSLRRHFLK